MKSRIIKERYYVPFHDQLAIARNSLKRVEDKEIGWLHECYVVLVFSALAVESIAITYGKELGITWEGQKHGTTVEKIKKICLKLDIAYLPGEHPWKYLGLVKDIRNKLVHPKSQDIRTEEIIPTEIYEEVFYEYPKSEIERMVNESNAKKVFECAKTIKGLFYKAIGDKGHENLFADGCNGSGTTFEN